MANPKGIITRKDIIEDEALKWGDTYAESLKTSIKANKELVDSVKELNKQVQNFKVANSQKDYITTKQAATLETQKAIDAIKIEQAEDIKRQKIQREGIATMEAERKAKQAATDAEIKAQKAKESSVKLTVEERVQNEINNKALKQEALERLGLVGAYQKLSKERSDAARKLRDLIASENASTESIKKAQKEFETLNNKVRSADAAVGDFTKNVGRYPLGGFVNGIKNLISAFGVTGGITAFAGIMKGAYDTVKKFEQGLADLSAITGASGKDLDYLKRQAIELGKSTKGGAIAVVEAYKLIGSAKPELLSNVSALNQVTEATLTLSKAAGIEMPEAATALTDAMNQFGADASQAGMFIDALANGAKYGAAEIPQTTEALLKFGAVARSSNVNIKESTALIQLLAENGIKGADAGTALRNVLLKISAPDALPKEAQKSLKDLGISFELLKDKSVPIQEKFEALKPLLADNGKLLKAFGFENVVAARNIIEHTDRLKDLTAKMGEQGTAEEQAIIRSNTLQGKTDKLSSTYDSLVLSIGSGSGVVSNFFKFFVDGATDALNGLIRLNTSWDELFNKAKAEGTQSGAKIFNQKFNFFGGNIKELSDSARIIIRAQKDAIIDEIEKGNKDPKLIKERDRLISLLGSNPESVAKSIKEDAKTMLDVYQKELLENEKKLKEYKGQGLLKGVLGGGFDREKQLNEEKERLKKAIAEKISIIKQANIKNIQLNAKPKVEDTPGKIAPVDDKEAEKARKKALERQKQLNDALYELNKQSLEQIRDLNKEVASEQENDDALRIEALKQSQKAEADLLLLNKKHALEQAGISKNDEIRINEDYSFKIIELNKKTQEEIDKINEFDQAKYANDLEDKISKNNEAMNTELEAENRKFIALVDLEKMSQKDREAAIEKHEQEIFDIKKKYAIKALKLQISNLETELTASDALPKKERLTAKERQKIAETLTKAKLDLSDVELSKVDDKNKKTVDKEKITSEKILEISADLTRALGDLGNAIFERKIQNIDEEITKNDEYYAKQIELAGNDQRKKDILTQEAEKKRKKLEDEKRKEQHKQAVFNKAVTIAQIAIQTALSVMKGFADSGYVGAILAGVLGAISLAAAIATPIPKYKIGRKGGPEELAIVGDGGRSEIIERTNGLIEMTPATDTLVKLNAGDKVHSSVDEYLRLQKASMLASIDMQGRKVSDFQATQIFNSNSDALLKELQENTRAIKNQKNNTVVNVPKVDFAHEFWKMRNTNWN